MTHFVAIAGAGGAIGTALVEQYLQDGAGKWRVFALTRPESRGAAHLDRLASEHCEHLTVLTLDATDETEVELAARKIGSVTAELDHFVNAIGFLREGNTQPEKSLRNVEKAPLMRSFEVNTLPNLYFAKHLLPFFRHGRACVFMALSARIGSISDNQLGGWYGYRMSKAALNMAIRNIHLEFSRRGTQCTVCAVHPGTTHSPLTEGLIDNVTWQVRQPAETAALLIHLMFNLKRDFHGGRLVDFDGGIIEF